MTRAHVRLLGPCFKTGRVEDRPTCPRLPRTTHLTAPQLPDACHRLDRSKRPTHDSTRTEHGTVRTSSIWPPLSWYLLADRYATKQVQRRRYNARDRTSPSRATFSASAVTALRAIRSVRASSPSDWKCVKTNDTTASWYLCRHQHHSDHPSRLNPRSGPTSWLHPLAYKRFHVLLNSLFKVLCNFPSQYLFAIGLAVIFSLNRSLPATLGCTFKQPDSNVPRLARPARVAMGLPPALGKSCSKELATLALVEASTPTPTWHRTARRNRRQAFTLGSSRFTRRY